MTAPSVKLLVGRIVLIGVGVAVGILIGNRQGHEAEAAAALARAEKSAGEAARLHHPDFPAKSPPPTTRDLHKLGIKIDPADIGGTLRSILQLTHPEEKIAAVRQLMSAIPEDRWLEVLRVPELREDAAIFATAFEYIAMKGPEGCLATLQEQGDWDNSGSLLRAWAWYDLPAALAFIEAHPEQMAKSGSYAFFASREYSLTNPDAALTWIGTLPEAAKHDAAMAWMGVAAKKDVAAAVRAYESGPDYLRGGRQAELICDAWAAFDPEAALGWAGGLPGREGQYAEAQLIKAWAGRDFDAAIKAVSTLPAEVQGPILKRLLEGLVAKTPEDLAQMRPLIEAFPEGEERARATRHLVVQWSNSDATAAGAWVDGLAPGPTRDGAIIGLGVPNMSDEFPASSERRTTIQDPEARQTALKQNVFSWLQQAPEAARAWVKDSPKLTPEDREALLKITGK